MIPLLMAAQRCRFAADGGALAAHLLSHEAGSDYLGEELTEPTADLAHLFTVLGDGSCICHNWDGASPQPLTTDADMPHRTDISWVYVLRAEGPDVISTRRDPDDLRGPVLPWNSDLHHRISEASLHSWQPDTPAPPRRAQPGPTRQPATATTVRLVTGKPSTQ